MNTELSQSGELEELLAALVDGELNERQFARFQHLLAECPAAEEYYRRYMRLCAMLEFEHVEAKNNDGNELDANGNDGSGMLGDELLVQRWRPSLQPSSLQSVVEPSHSTFLFGTIHSMAGYVSSGWPMAYLLATVIVGLGLLIGSLMIVPPPVQVARQSTRPSQSTIELKQEYVGRITGMVDCRWADESTAAFHGAHVPLGRKYALISGLMEIAYDTGAKVVLQGPVTYEVESKKGGFLSIGKLTVRVEKGDAVRSMEYEVRSGATSETAENQNSEIRNQKLFAVRTPMAVLTDLGTEFGVEVLASGLTSTHVFRGVVELQPMTRDAAQGQTIRLTENESAKLEKQSGSDDVTVSRGEVDPTVFVRTEHLPRLAKEFKLKPLRRWQAYSRQLRNDPALLAYYTFEPHDGSLSILQNQSAAGGALDGEIHNAEWVDGRFPGKLALLFHGPGSGDKVVLPHQERFNFTGAYSVAVWCKMRFSVSGFQSLAGKGNAAWRLYQFGNMPQFGTGECYRSDFHQLETSPRDFASRWQLLVAVSEPELEGDSKRLYVDGQLEAEAHAVPRILLGNEQPVWLGSNSAVPDFELHGWIDEVAIFSCALSADEIGAMFRAGNPYR